MNERRLLSTRRLVPEERQSQYDTAWLRLHAAATERGAHAWRFLSAERADLYIEFLEFGAEKDPRADPAVAGALRQLETAFADPPPVANRVDEWREVRRE